LQDFIYKLSKVGQAIDKDDLPAASSVLGPSSDAQWVQNINAAFSKVLPLKPILTLLAQLLLFYTNILFICFDLCVYNNSSAQAQRRGAWLTASTAHWPHCLHQVVNVQKAYGSFLNFSSSSDPSMLCASMNESDRFHGFSGFSEQARR
jgi:hypothetical protein